MAAVPSPGGANMKYVVFVIIYVSYAVCYFARRNAVFWNGPAVREGVLVPTDIGWFTTAFEAFSGVCKVVGGLVVDANSPSLVLAGSLSVIGLTNILWLATPSVGVKVALWGVNGWFQGFAWPALARIFMSWFPRPEERGLWYSILATSQNAGAAVVPFVLAWPVLEYGWHAALIVPGVVAIIAGLFCWLFLADAPPTGLTATDKLKLGNTPRAAQSAASTTASVSAATTFKLVLRSKTLWLLGVSYFFNSLTRSIFTDWVALLAEAQVGRQLTAADVSGVVAGAVSSYEIGGAIGGLASGIVSDRYFGGRRGPVMVVFGVLLTPLPFMLLASANLMESFSNQFSLAFLLIGLCGFAPHVINGLAAREFSVPEIQSSAGGFTKALGQLGGAVAGYPISVLAEWYGWDVVMWIASVSALLSAVSVLPLWSTTSLPPSPAGSTTARSDGAATAGDKSATPAGSNSVVTDTVSTKTTRSMSGGQGAASGAGGPGRRRGAGAAAQASSKKA